MGDITQKIDVVQDIGKATVDLLEIGFPPASYSCPVDEMGPDALKQDDRYGEALDKMVNRLSEFGEVEVDDEFFTESEPHLDLRATRYIDQEEFSILNIGYSADGTGVIVGEFLIDGGWYTAVDHHPAELDTLDVGRYIARAELALLAHELESPADTLDYWVTEGSDYHDSEYSQSSWAKIRNVSRQAVSDRVRSAEDKLRL